MRQRLSVCVAVAILANVSAFAGDTLESVEKFITDQSAKIASMQFKSATTQNLDISGMKMDSKMDGTYEYVKKGDKMMYRSEMTTKGTTTREGKTENSDGKTLMVCDGEFMYVYNESAQGKTAMKSKVTQPVSMLVDFKAQHDAWNLKLLAEETVDGKSCHAIEGTTKTEATPGTFHKIVTYYDKGNGVGIKTVAYDPAGKTIMTSTTSDVKINVEIPADRFVFKCPEGVQMMDMTQQQQQAQQPPQPEEKKAEETKEPTKEPAKPAEEKKDDKKLKLPKLPGKKP